MARAGLPAHYPGLPPPLCLVEKLETAPPELAGVPGRRGDESGEGCGSEGPCGLRPKMCRRIQNS
ncbi:MAG TPA: hypothetical protein DFS52_30490 [Myxococcales bacterium]|nr:hypothetical protein [Myxococcales bacterium]